MAASKPRRGNPALRLALIRQLHVYLSIFIAPSLLFFAGTGALQTFRIPDEKTAPVLLQKLARVHRDDVFALKPAAPPKKSDPSKPKEAPKPKPKTPASTTALKWFFASVSVAIIISTLLGLWMAVAYHKRKAVIWIVLAAGALAPVVILIL